eukprot:NODE_135_length_16508_cov_1.365897.p3 type:complete len:405 gc:universal NODE_135_length_16508_cov_1.365897:11013-12227(+)
MSEAGFYVFLVIVELFMIVMPILLVIRRKSEYIDKRDWKPLVILAVVNIVTATLQIFSLSPLWGITFERSCIISPLALPMTIFTFVGIYFMRCLRLFRDYYYNQTKSRSGKVLDGFEKFLLKGFITRRKSLKAARRKDSSNTSSSFLLNVTKTSGSWKRAIGIPLAIVLFGFVFGSIYGGYKCVNALPIVFTMVSLYAIMTLTFFILLRKVKDPYFVKFEMLASSVLFIVLILASGGQYAVLGKNKNPSEVDVALPGIYPLIIVIMSNVLSYLMPVVLSFKSKNIIAKEGGTKSSDIKSILHNKQECAEFLKLCADYFVLENALFLQAYDNVKLSPTEDGLKMLYKEFIQSGATNELNINGALRSKVRLNLENPLEVQLQLMDVVEKQISKLLEENILRHYLDD